MKLQRQSQPRYRYVTWIALLVLGIGFSIFTAWRVYNASKDESNSSLNSGDNTPAVLRSNRRQLETSIQSIDKKLSTIEHSISAQSQQQPCPSTSNQQVVVSTQVKNSRKFHVLTTCQGFSNQWQARIHYYWYKKQRDACEALEGNACDMGGFTRILHSGHADDLMDEIPTLVVNPLPKEIMKDSSYIVLNRPYAFQQWLQLVSIPEKYVIMAEADHLWMRPLPNLMNGEAPGAAHFTYIVPADDRYRGIVKRFVGESFSDQEWNEEAKRVPQIGNSPTMLSVKDLRDVAGAWYDMTMAIFDDKEAHEAWNWVLEMYGYSLASYKMGQHKGMAIVDSFLAHPPFDKNELNYQSKPFYLLHLTYPIKFNSTGGLTEDKDQVVWSFDKRDYGSTPPPRHLTQPPSNVDCNLCRLIISMLNEATDSIPCWDTYVSSNGTVSHCE